MTADELCKMMETMRRQGVARVRVGDVRLELGAQAPSEMLSQALGLARAHVADEAAAQVHGPAEIEAPAPVADRALVDEEDPHGPPRTPPRQAPKREALLALDPSDPLYYQLADGEKGGAP